MSGGSLRILGSPLTLSVSFANALRLVLDRAFATLRSNRFLCFPVARSANSAPTASTSMREYQRSRLRDPARPLIASR